MTERSTYLHVKANAMSTAHLKEDAVVYDTQITVQEPGAKNGETIRIWRRLENIITTQRNKFHLRKIAQRTAKLNSFYLNSHT